MEDKPIEKPKRGRPKKVVIVGEPSEVQSSITKRVIEELITVLPESVKDFPESSETPSLSDESLEKHRYAIFDDVVPNDLQQSELLDAKIASLKEQEEHLVLRADKYSTRADKYGTKDEQILYYGNLIRQIEIRRQKRYDTDVYEHLIRNKRTITEEIDLVKTGKSHLPLRLRNHILTMKVL